MQHKSRAPIRSSLCTLGVLALIFQLAGCSVIGGVIGNIKDNQESRTRIVPVAEAGSLRKGAMVFLTIPNRETLKGRFEELGEREGKKSILLRTPDGEMRIGLADVTEIVEDYRNHDKLIKGALIGGAVDAVLIGATIWIVHEMSKMDVIY